MDIDDDEASVTVYRPYNQPVEMMNLPVPIPTVDSGERAGNMSKGFEFLPPEQQLVLLRQAFRRPYVAPEIREWIYANNVSPQEITSLVRGRGVFIDDDRDRCPLIDFDHWADVNAKLRMRGIILPCDMETGYNVTEFVNTPDRPQIDDREDENELVREDRGFLRTCVEIVVTGLAVSGNYFFSEQPRRT